jgi:hypothetical protein
MIKIDDYTKKLILIKYKTCSIISNDKDGWNPRLILIDNNDIESHIDGENEILDFLLSLKTITINFDNLSYHSAVSILTEILIKILESFDDITDIISNDKICSCLQENYFYKYQEYENISNILNVGFYGDKVRLNIDINQTSDDNIIFFKNNDNIIITIKIIDDNNILN